MAIAFLQLSPATSIEILTFIWEQWVSRPLPLKLSMHLVLLTAEVMHTLSKQPRSIKMIGKYERLYYRLSITIKSNLCQRDWCHRFTEMRYLSYDKSFSPFYYSNKNPRLSLWQTSINKALIIMSNTSLLNPGPANTLSVVYQNVQGLIPFSNLADNCPNLM